MLDANDDIISIEELARKLNIKPASVRARIRRKQLPAHKLCHRLYVLRSELIGVIRQSDFSMD